MLTQDEQAALVRDRGPFLFVEGTDVWLPEDVLGAPTGSRLGVVTKRWRDRVASVSDGLEFGPIRCFVEVPEPSGRVSYLDFLQDELREATGLAAQYLQVFGPSATVVAGNPSQNGGSAFAVLSSVEITAALGFAVPDGWYTAVGRSTD